MPDKFNIIAGMPGNGYSGRANNLEDYTDPYGGGDVPGPYGIICKNLYRNAESEPKERKPNFERSMVKRRPRHCTHTTLHTIMRL